MSKQFTFKKEERLKSRKEIAGLFGKGQSFGAYPLRVVWKDMDVEEGTVSKYPVKITFTVPKKRFKNATDRNHLKRQIREAYRLKKHKLYHKMEGKEKPIAMMIIYTGQEKMPYGEIERSVSKIVGRLGKMLRKKDSASEP